MPQFVNTDSFKLLSVDHDQVLLSSDIKSSRHLLSETSDLPNALELSFTLNSEEVTKTLHKRSGAFKENVQFTTSDESEPTFEFKHEDFVSFESSDKSFVMTFSKSSDKFEGVYFTDKINHFVGRDGEMKVDSSVTELFPEVGRKLLSEANGIIYWDNCHRGQGQGLSALDMGFALGNVLLRNEGQSGSLEIINTAVVLANTIYQRQMDIVLRIANVFYATSPQSFAPSSCSLDMSNQLSRFRSWNTRPSKEPMWHLIDDCFGAFGNTLGIAYISGACGSGTNTGVTQYFSDQYPSDQYQTWATFAHEVGHNVAAQHSFENGQGNTRGIMDYGTIRSKEINGESQFNTVYRKQEVCAKMDSAARSGCMTLGVGPNPTSQFTALPEARVVEIAEEERELKCFRHRNRILRTSENGRARELKTLFSATRATCKKECETLKDCSSFSLSDDGFCELSTGALVEDLSFQSSFTSFLCFDSTKFSSEDQREMFKQKLISNSLDDRLEAFKADAELEQKCCSTQVDQTLLGMNFFSDQTLTESACYRRCVKTSKCEVATFDKSTKNCLFYNDAMYSANTFVPDVNINSFSCDRTCLEVEVRDVTVEDEEGNVSSNGSSSAGNTVGAVFGLLGMIMIALAVGMFIRKKQIKNEQAHTASENGEQQEAEVKHNTL